MLYITLALLLISTSASAVKFSGNPKLVRCVSPFLNKSLPQLTGKSGSQIHASIEHLGQLPSALKHNGLSAVEIQVISDLLYGTFKRHSEDSIIAHMAQQLGQLSRTRKMLALCILEDCELKSEEGITLLAGNEAFALADVQNLNPGDEEKLLDSYHREHRVRPRIIILDPLSKDAVMQFNWAAMLFQQLSHYSDLELIQQWLQAGKSLRQLHQPVDTYFDRYVRMVSHKDSRREIPLIDEGFYHAFIAARSYHARDFLPYDKFRDLFEEFTKASQTQAIRILNEKGDLTAPVLNAFGIDEKTLYGFGLEVGKTFAETIARANRQSFSNL